MATRPMAEHAWLQRLVGEWRVVTEFSEEPGGPTVRIETTERVTSLGGLWAVREGEGAMPDGTPATTTHVLGYDVTLKEYRGCFYGSMTSHLWTYVGTLSDDGRTMTLDGNGPSMTDEGGMVPYRDVIELVDENTRTQTTSGQDESGAWVEFMKATSTRL